MVFKYQLKVNEDEVEKNDDYNNSELISLLEISEKFKDLYNDYIFVYINQEDELQINQKIFEIKIESVKHKDMNQTMIQLKDITKTLNKEGSQNEKILIQFLADTMKTDFHAPIKAIKEQNRKITTFTEKLQELK